MKAYTNFSEKDKKEIEKKASELIGETVYATTNKDGGYTFVNGSGNALAGTFMGYGFAFGSGNLNLKELIPTKIIYSCPVTVCIFPDGKKKIARCGEEEEYIKETGVMVCIIKKIFGTWDNFMKSVGEGYENTDDMIQRHYHNDHVPYQRHPD